MSRQYRLLGHPLGHSMSPPIHTRLFTLASHDGEYALCDAPPEDLSTAVPSLLRECAGFNVTIPHKVAVIPYLDALDESAARYGAVNCVRCGDENIGYNTDVTGFVRSIEALGASLSKSVLLLGCGGVGRMMAVEVILSGGTLTIAVRGEDIHAAQELREELLAKRADASVTVCLLCDEFPPHDLLINATPVGMYPHEDASPLPGAFPSVRFVFDAVYNPVETHLLRDARTAGIPAMGGMSMLVLQAAAAHEIWYGAQFRTDDLAMLTAEMERQVAASFR